MGKIPIKILPILPKPIRPRPRPPFPPLPPLPVPITFVPQPYPDGQEHEYVKDGVIYDGLTGMPLYDIDTDQYYQ